MCVVCVYKHSCVTMNMWKPEPHSQDLFLPWHPLKIQRMNSGSSTEASCPCWCSSPAPPCLSLTAQGSGVPSGIEHGHLQEPPRTLFRSCGWSSAFRSHRASIHYQKFSVLSGAPAIVLQKQCVVWICLKKPILWDTFFFTIVLELLLCPRHSRQF